MAQRQAMSSHELQRSVADHGELLSGWPRAADVTTGDRLRQELAQREGGR